MIKVTPLEFDYCSTRNDWLIKSFDRMLSLCIEKGSTKASLHSGRVGGTKIHAPPHIEKVMQAPPEALAA